MAIRAILPCGKEIIYSYATAWAVTDQAIKIKNGEGWIATVPLGSLVDSQNGYEKPNVKYIEQAFEIILTKGKRLQDWRKLKELKKLMSKFNAKRCEWSE